MANEFIDGFDLYPVGTFDADSGNPWGLIGDVNSQPVVTGTAPINGLRSLQTPVGINDNLASYAFRTITSSAAVVLGYAVKVLQTAAPGGNPQDFNMVGVFGAGESFAVNLSGNLIEARINGVLIATGTTQLPIGSRQYIEVVLTQASWEIWLNGVLEISGANAFGGNFDQVRIGKLFPNFGILKGEYQIDDIYINNTSAERWGDTSIVALFPDADTVQADWTPTGVASGFQALDNNPPLTTEYIESTAAGQKSVFDLPDLPANVFQIFTVYTKVRAEKTIAGVTEISTGLIQNAVEVDGAPFPVNENTYTWHEQQFATDPDTGLAWNPNTFAPQLVLERTT